MAISFRRNPKDAFLGLIDHRALILAFFIPFVVRMIPEILMGPYVVGFDTLAYYIPSTLTWLQQGINFWNFLALAPFFYAILMGTTSVGIPIVISIKVISPLLLGFFGLAVYCYAKKTLSWSPRKSLLVVLFATLYFVALRISWDMLRSELALIFLFVALFFLERSNSSKKNGIILSLAMILVVFAHQLVAVIMFAIIIATIVSLYRGKKMSQLFMSIVYALPAVLMFLTILFLSSSSIIRDFPSQSSEGFKALFGFTSYSGMVFNTFSFLAFCYLPLVPLLVVNFKKFKGNLQLNAWIVLILIMLLIVVVSPNAFLAVLPYRWVLLLTYPLAFFAADAFSKIKSRSYKRGIALILTIMSVSFIVLPDNLAFPYYLAFTNYVPTSMLQNTVALSDTSSVTNALQWVKTNMPANGRLLVHYAFIGWAYLELNKDCLISYGFNNPETTASEVQKENPNYQLYLIWWVNGSGWQGQPTVSSAFKPVYESGSIAIYIYSSSISTSTFELNHPVFALSVQYPEAMSVNQYN